MIKEPLRTRGLAQPYRPALRQLSVLYSALIGLLMLVSLSIIDAAQAETSDQLERCLALAGQVADSCPHACTQRRCATRCIPPFMETGRCGRCQENCATICNAMDESRRAACHEPEQAPDGMDDSELEPGTG